MNLNCLCRNAHRKLQVIALLLALLPAEALSQPEQLVIRKLEVKQDVVSSYAKGVEVQFELVYNGPANRLFREAQIAVYLVGQDGNPVRSRVRDEAVSDGAGFLRLMSPVDVSASSTVTTHYFFLPYSVLDLRAGEQSLLVRPRLKRSLKEPAEVAVNYEGTDGRVNFAMPPLVAVRFGVAEFEAETTDLSGNPWDDRLGLSGSGSDRWLPDPLLRLELAAVKTTLTLYQTDPLRNTATGSFPMSTTFYMVDGDQMTVRILDSEDLGEPQGMGVKHLSLDELRSQAAQAAPLQFDRIKRLVPQVEIRDPQ